MFLLDLTGLSKVLPVLSYSPVSFEYTVIYRVRKSLLIKQFEEITHVWTFSLLKPKMVPNKYNNGRRTKLTPSGLDFIIIQSGLSLIQNISSKVIHYHISEQFIQSV